MGKMIERIGETNIANNGMKMTIIAYRKNNDIDIQFEDGTIVYNKRYERFKIGSIRYPVATNRIGETRMMNCGLKVTIINYHNNSNIDVQFEDGTIIYNKRYIEFKKGTIKHPAVNTEKIDRTGETRIMNCGLKAKIINYHNTNNIDVQFEDGTITYNKRYIEFKKGEIGHPIVKTNKIDRTGETRIMNCELKATIINYHNTDNIDVKFEDGTVTYNKRYIEFKKGIINHPTIKTKKVDHTGETNIAKNGMKMTIIAYKRYRDIDIQFEDGTIVYNKKYYDFKNGDIKYPAAINRISETRMMKCGLKATIMQYDSAYNINIQFEDSTVIYNKRYAEFKKGKIGHPNIINTIKLKEFAYKLNNDWYYICSHPDWNEDKILSVKEIYAYQLKQAA